MKVNKKDIQNLINIYHSALLKGANNERGLFFDFIKDLEICLNGKSDKKNWNEIIEEHSKLVKEGKASWVD